MLTLLMLLQIITHHEDASIRSLLQRQQDAWNRGDIAGYMEGYWISDSLVFTSGGTVHRGWKATLEKYQRSYPTGEAMGVLSFSDIEVTVLPGGESAWALGRWELRRDGDRPGGVFSLVLRKFGADWKIVHDHTSSSTR